MRFFFSCGCNTPPAERGEGESEGRKVHFVFLPFSTVLDGTCSNQFSDADLLRPLPFTGTATRFTAAALVPGVAMAFTLVTVCVVSRSGVRPSLGEFLINIFTLKI